MEKLEARDDKNMPSIPTITDWSEHEVHLEWEDHTETPENPTMAFTIEKKDRHGGMWDRAAFMDYHEILNTDSNFAGDKVYKITVENLIECNSYQFRIIAEKNEGPTEPGPVSKPVICKSRFVAPRIYRQTLKDILVATGQVMVRLSVRVTGEPQPTVTWKNENCGDLSKSPRCIVETGHTTANSFNSNCTIKAAERVDSSVYTIVASNNTGAATLSFNVNFTEKPGRPEGPIEVFDLHNTGCTLDWLEPTDTGGLPIDRYEIEIQYENTDIWLQHARTTLTTAPISGLIKGTRYYFRVLAHNKMGYSLPQTTRDSTLIKNPVETPSKPQNATIASWDKDFATISWEPPLKDGGYPITGYVIEKRHISGSEDWSIYPADPEKCEGTVDGLTPGERYEFGVYAANEMGRGPADTTRTLVARCMKLQPEVCQKNLGRVYIGSGEPCYANVDVNGEPPPDLCWRFNGEKLREDSEHVSFSYKDYNSKIKLTNLGREHSGQYTLVATNIHGKHEGHLYLTITDRTFPPTGPLEVTEIRSNSCHLSWGIPSDNGGARIDGYIVDKMDELHGVWIRVADLKGENTLECDVPDLEDGHRYHFKVRCLNKSGKSLPLQTREKILIKTPFGAPCPPLSVEVTDFDFDHVDLSWKPPSFDGGSEITGYTVQKKLKLCPTVFDANAPKADECKEWEDVNDFGAEVTKCKIRHLVIDNIYQFRVLATNKTYGLGAPSEPSDPFKIKHSNVEPTIESRQMKEVCIEHGTPINYNVDVFGEPPPTKTWILNGVNLNRAGQMRVRITDEDYHTKIAIRDTKRVDTGSLTLKIENRNGSDSHTVNIVVLGPPEPPFKVRTKEPSKCAVTMFWKPPKDDGGSPVKKYWVEKMDLADNIWMKAQPDPVMTINTRVHQLHDGHSYQFRVKAVNANGESEPSEPSDTVTIKEPMGRLEWMQNCMKLLHTSAETKEPEPKAKSCEPEEKESEDGPNLSDIDNYSEEGRTIA